MHRWIFVVFGWTFGQKIRMKIYFFKSFLPKWSFVKLIPSVNELIFDRWTVSLKVLKVAAESLPTNQVGISNENQSDVTKGLFTRDKYFTSCDVVRHRATSCNIARHRATLYCTMRRQKLGSIRTVSHGVAQHRTNAKFVFRVNRPLVTSVIKNAFCIALVGPSSSALRLMTVFKHLLISKSFVEDKLVC
jgi:hypothetical protein